VRLGNLATPFKNQRFGGMVSGEISLPSGDPGYERLIQNGIGETLAGLVEKQFGIRCQRSSPPARISFISGERLWQACAGNGLAEITAPVSFMIVVVILASIPTSSQSSPGFLRNTATS